MSKAADKGYIPGEYKGRRAPAFKKGDRRTKEIAAKSAKAKHEAAIVRRTLRELAEMVRDQPDVESPNKSNGQVLIEQMYMLAKAGDARSAELLAKIMGDLDRKVELSVETPGFIKFDIPEPHGDGG